MNKEKDDSQEYKWISLHRHTNFSFMDGIVKPKDAIDLAKERGQTVFAMTDHGNIIGHMSFYQECLEQGIQFLPGLEAYITPENRRHIDKDQQLDRKRHHITILAQNEIGYKNLCKLSSLSYTEGFYYKPRIDLQLLEHYKEGLIVLSGCSDSVLSEYLRTEQFDKAESYLKRMKETFGDNFYGETMVHYLPNFRKYHSPEEYYTDKDGNKVYLCKNLYDKHKELCQKCGVKRVITDDSHYLRPEDQEFHEAAVAIGTASKIDDPNRLSFENWDLSSQDPEYVVSLCQEMNDMELVDNVIEIQKKCSFNYKLREYKFPAFPVPDSIRVEINPKDTSQDIQRKKETAYLREEVIKGIKTKNYKVTSEVGERIKMELGVISQMGFSGYLLLVQDSILWAKQHMPVGPGRGSSSGSLVCYLIGITEIDPMTDTSSFLFTRFLNPARVSMPDIDTDYADNKKAMEYFMKRWNSPTSVYEINGQKYFNNQLAILTNGNRIFVDELKVGDDVEVIR